MLCMWACNLVGNRVLFPVFHIFSHLDPFSSFTLSVMSFLDVVDHDSPIPFSVNCASPGRFLGNIMEYFPGGFSWNSCRYHPREPSMPYNFSHITRERRDEMKYTFPWAWVQNSDHHNLGRNLNSACKFRANSRYMPFAQFGFNSTLNTEFAPTESLIINYMLVSPFIS